MNDYLFNENNYLVLGGGAGEEQLNDHAHLSQESNFVSVLTELFRDYFSSVRAEGVSPYFPNYFCPINIFPPELINFQINNDNPIIISRIK